VEVEQAVLPTSQTHRGFHVFFNAEIDDGITKYEDGELRAGNGYVVLPPSQHPDGGQYKWLVPPGDAIPFLENDAVLTLAGRPHTSLAGVIPIPPQVEYAIARTLPTGNGQRHNCIFAFARRLKGLPDLDTSAATLSAYITEWHRQALPFIRTKGFEKTDLAFYDAWNGAQVPLTDNQLLPLVEAALVGPDPDWLQEVFLPQACKQLVRVCAALQERTGSEPFFLAARAAAAVLQMDPTHTSRLLKRLVKVGYLEMVKKGDFASGEATTWLYKGPQVTRPTPVATHSELVERIDEVVPSIPC